MRFIAKFKIYNGESTYEMPVTVEADSKEEAEMYFKKYECETDIEIWRLQVFDEVKTFDDLWGWL